MKVLGEFCFVDEVAEVRRNEGITTYFKLKGHEEFLLDHFKDFPVMPGVLLMETLKQAASTLLKQSGDPRHFRLARATDIKFGQFVKPGNLLKAQVSLTKKGGDQFSFSGRLDLSSADKTSTLGKTLSAHFDLRALS